MVCVCVVIPFILGARLMDASAGVTQEESHTGFLHLPSAVLALIFLARRIQPSLSLVDHEVELWYSTCMSTVPFAPSVVAVGKLKLCIFLLKYT